MIYFNVSCDARMQRTHKYVYNKLISYIHMYVAHT
jgi:hypothetical protein